MPNFAKPTQATVIPCLRYRDAPAAIKWLCATFGFEKHLVVPNDDGTIAHAQLSFGNGMVMLGSVMKEATEFGLLVKQPDEVGAPRPSRPTLSSTMRMPYTPAPRQAAPALRWRSGTKTTAGAASAATTWKAICGASELMTPGEARC